VAKEDATEKAADGHVWSSLVMFPSGFLFASNMTIPKISKTGHVWSRLVIFGHVQAQNPSTTCSFSSSSSILRTSQRHDIFQNFKNLPALQSLAGRPYSSLPQ